MTDAKHRYHVLDSTALESALDTNRDFAFDVLAGLTERPKRLPSKYFYDDRGSEIFSRICEIDEYYPTRCEHEILETYAAAICEDARHSGPFNLVEFGAGDGRKTMVLLEHLAEARADFRYVPLDISEGAMRGLIDSLAQRVPTVETEGLVCEYFDGLRWLNSREPDRRSLVLFLGSNIGNFDRPRARAFLRRLWTALRPKDQTLIGFDLKKDIELLLHAYNDSAGVTADFNLNLLDRINRELDADFDLKKWRHFATYNVFSGAMESYLVSQASQDVHIGALQTTFSFAPWEPIHTEYSYKYLVEDIERLARDTGFAVDHLFHDRRRWFVDALWRRAHGAMV
jgi:dimethylhistidine N-methyltransferase